MKIKAASPAAARAFASALDSAAGVPIPGRAASRFQPGLSPGRGTETMVDVAVDEFAAPEWLRHYAVDPGNYAADAMRARLWWGGHHVLSAGDYVIDSPIVVGPGATLRGEHGARLVARGLGNLPVIDARGAVGCTITGIEVDVASSPGAFPVGIYADGADHAVIRDVQLSNSGQVGPNDTVQGILARFHAGLTVEDVYSNGCQIKLAGPGGDVRGLRVRRVHSFGAHNHGISLVLTEPAGHVVEDCIIEDCTFDSPWQSGLFIGDDGPTMGNVFRGIRVSRCRFTPSQTGDDGINVHACDETGIEITDCDFEGHGDRGVAVNTFLAGQSADVVIRGGTCSWDQLVRMSSPGQLRVEEHEGAGQVAVQPSSLGGCSVVLRRVTVRSPGRSALWVRNAHPGVEVDVDAACATLGRVQLDESGGRIRAALKSSADVEVVSGSPAITFKVEV